MCNHATLYHIEENRYETSGSVRLSVCMSVCMICMEVFHRGYSHVYRRLCWLFFVWFWVGFFWPVVKRYYIISCVNCAIKYLC